MNINKKIAVEEGRKLVFLDIGCGSGVYTSKLGEMGYKVIGVDYLEVIIHKANDSSKNTKYLIADGYRKGGQGMRHLVERNISL